MRLLESQVQRPATLTSVGAKLPRVTVFVTIPSGGVPARLAAGVALEAGSEVDNRPPASRP